MNTFLGWSDGGAQSHEIVVPPNDQNYVATFATAQVVLPGDYNSDQSVGAGDYTLWRKKLSSSAILPNDMTPGSVTVADYNIWKAHFGETTAQGRQLVMLPEDYGASEVPDPALLRITAILLKDTTPGSVMPDVEMANRRHRQPVRSNGSREHVRSQFSPDLLFLALPTTSPENARCATSAYGAAVDTNKQSQDDADVSLIKTHDSIFAAMGQTWKPRPAYNRLERL